MHVKIDLRDRTFTIRGNADDLAKLWLDWVQDKVLETFQGGPLPRKMPDVEFEVVERGTRRKRGD